MSEADLVTLPNHLRVISVPMPHLHSIELACYLGVGGRHDPRGQEGIAHFVEHMLFRGTAEHPDSQALERAFEAIGGAVNAATDCETTCFHTRVHPDHLAAGIGLFASMLLRPSLTGIDTERRIILEEAREDFNQDGEEINPDNLTGQLLWPDHPMGVPTIGTESGILAVDRAALERHRERFYCPNNAVIVAAGRLDPAELLAAVEDCFGDWNVAELPEEQPVSGWQPVDYPQFSWVEDADSQVMVQLAFALPGRDTAELIPLRLLRRVLGGSGPTRLMQRLREELGLTYNVEANLSLYADCGVLSIDLAVAPENLVEAVQECVGVLTRLVADGVDEEELAAIKRTYLFDLDFSRDQPEAHAVRYGWGEIIGLRRDIAEDSAEIAATNAEQIRVQAEQLFVPGRLCAAFVGPFESQQKDQVEKLLRTF
ncbi:MAG: insulinase family protein [Desulfuromonas sp.]|nr:MAG: insulinase family protein [Desulfuromonas sp.]